MKKIIVFVLAFMPLMANAQDVIVKKDGSTILSKVLEVNPSDIKYKKFSNQNGPTYTIDKAEVMSINYENGEKDLFDNSSTPSNANGDFSSQRFIEKSADKRNRELISFYNRYYEPTSKIRKSKKKAKRILVIVGMKSTSLLSDGDVEMQITTQKREGPYYDYWCQELNIKNNTNRTIYIDKGNCFRISSDTQLYCYFDSSEQTTISSGRGNGVSLGLGSVAGAFGIGGVAGTIANGISVGTGSSSSISTTYSQQRVMPIPAMSSRSLTTDKWVDVNRTILADEKELVESMERFQFKNVRTKDIGIKKGDICVGEALTFGESDLPWTRRYLITYSFDEAFSTYSQLTAEFYIQEIIGAPSLMSPMNYRPTLGGLMEDELKYDKYVNEFNDYTIIGYHKFDDE
ncbi:MAG: hypothetical protein SPL50_06105 [Alloprevotella sp.]|nr:hypothetical protein [Alloprevotella sp.]